MSILFWIPAAVGSAEGHVVDPPWTMVEMFQYGLHESKCPRSHMSRNGPKLSGNVRLPRDRRCFRMSLQRFSTGDPVVGRPPLNGRTPSVKDVAAAAGVSLGTVSNVMNRPEMVSVGTRERVERAMLQLGFVRNESARQLRAGTSRTLAYVMLDGTNPFFHDVAQGIELAADDADLSLFICNSRGLAEREAVHIDRLMQQRVQGILITPVNPASPTLDEVSRRGIPVVIVDRTREGGGFCSVAVDDVYGGRVALEHLLDTGHTRVAFV